MLKRLTLLGTWTLLFCAVVVAGQGNKDSGPDNHPSQQDHVTPIQPNADNANAQAARQQNQAGSVPPERDAAFKWAALRHDPNWWLVIVAALTGGFICWQSWEIHKQNRHMMNKERARIDVGFPNGHLELDDGPEWTESMRVVYAGVEITVSNLGATRAFNVAAKANIIGAPAVTNAKSEEISLLTLPSVIGPEDVPIKADVITLLAGVNHVAAVDDGSEILHLVGRIAYEDVFGKKHVTKFRYLWDVDVMYVEGQSVDCSRWKKTGKGNKAT